MTTQERKSIDRKFKLFISRNFESPKKCKNIHQIQFYIRELSDQIEYFKKNFNYVPDEAYSMLSDYNQTQNKHIYSNFQAVYC